MIVVLLAWVVFIMLDAARFRRSTARQFWRLSELAEWHTRLTNHLLDERRRLIRDGVELDPLPRRIMRDIRPGATERWARMRVGAAVRARKRGRKLVRNALGRR